MSGARKIDEQLSLAAFKPDAEPHIRVDDAICRRCSADRLCAAICPAQNYSWDANAEHMSVAVTSCFECGTCRIVCADGAIDWRWPGGGTGVAYVWG
jgi:ferredoxin like protein